MEQNLEGLVIPKHVALILDGNGRCSPSQPGRTAT